MKTIRILLISSVVGFPTGCALDEPMVVMPSPLPIAIDPPRVKIGQPFVVRMTYDAKAAETFSMPADGDYAILIQDVDVDVPDIWRAMRGAPVRYRPHEEIQRASIGTVVVEGGRGESRFQLLPAYDGVAPTPGKGVWISAESRTWKGGVGAPILP
jgi:hypothetical protein